MNENQNNPIIVSHRLRGFDKHDASRLGALNALDKKIRHFEVDCRVTKDGEIVINHNARLGNEFQSQNYISETTLSALKKISYNGSSETILTLDELFQIIAQHKEVKLYLDIKENGKEESIIKKAASYNLLNNLVIVSWLPEVLLKFHTLLPTQQLCFSFYPVCNTITSTAHSMYAKILSKLLANKEHSLTFLFDSYNNEAEVSEKYGFDFEHFVSLPFTGKLLDVLQSVNGIVCVNYKYPSIFYIQNLKKQKLNICLYSINTKTELKKYTNKFQPDMILTDNASLVL